jgi:hypothetical protein
MQVLGADHASTLSTKDLVDALHLVKSNQVVDFIPTSHTVSSLNVNISSLTLS